MPPADYDVAAAYDRWAATYDIDANQTRELATAVLRQQNLKLTDCDVIEIGCGTGRNTQWLIENGAQVIALDFSAGMLRLAKDRVSSPPGRFVQHDITRAWPTADASADLVIAMLVLEHIKELQAVFAEAARTLRSGGELFVCELHPFRQMSGRQAEFTDPETGHVERVAACLHDVSEYVNTGMALRLQLLRMREWRDSGARPNDLPRLLSILFRKEIRL